MYKLKKSLAFLMSLLIILSCTGIYVFAEENEEHIHNEQTVISDDGKCEYTYCDNALVKNFEQKQDNSYADILLTKKLYPESKHNYDNYTMQNFAFSYPGAVKLTITFSSQTKTEQDYDIIYINDINNRSVGSYSGDELAGKTITVDGSAFRIRLTTDRSKTFYGFSIDKIEATVSLNSYQYENSREDIVSYPIMPGTVHNYNNNADETYTYTDADASSLSLYFSADTQTEQNFDFITIYDYEGDVVGRYSGSELAGRSVSVEGPSATIRLTSDHSQTYYGYELNNITSVKKDSAEDVRQYPASAHPYAYNSDDTASYTYPDENVKALKVTFSNKCMTEQNYDIITVRNADGSLAGKYSGDELAGRTVIVDGNSFSVNITSDRSKQFYGYAVTEVTPVTDDAGTYPESPHPYTNRASDTYHYESKNENAKALRVKFSNDTYTEKDYDIISVYDANGKLVGNYSGHQLSCETITVPTPSFDIKFKTDHSKTYYGFSIASIIEVTDDAAPEKTVAYPESNHNYENYADQDYSYVCTDPLVKSLKLKFSAKTKTEKDYDIITITDSQGKTVGKYSGDELAGKTVSVQGSSFNINFRTDRSKSFYGFSIDDITAVYDTDDFKKEELEHNYVKVIDRDASIYRDGTVVYACTNCGDTYNEYSSSYPAIGDLIITLSDDEYIYNGNTHYPRVSVKTKHGTSLIEGSDYDVKYSGNGKNIGYYYAEITLKNEYIGKSIMQYSVMPKNISGFKVKPVLGGFSVYWDAQTNEVDGYDIEYSSYSDFRTYETINESQSYYYAQRVSNLYRNKTYYVRMHSYKRGNNGALIYSNYTPVTSVTTGDCLYINTRAAEASYNYDNVTKEIFGYSYQGRPLEAYIITPANGRYRNTIVLNFAIHGFEGESYRDGRYLVEEGNSVVEYFARNPGDLKNMRLVVIPCLNPDGVISGTNELYTGSSSFGRNTANHVDLNRDFNSFRGQESRAMRSLLQKYNPDVFCDFHGWLNTTLGTPKMCDIFSDTLGLSRKQANHYGSSSGYMIGYVHDTYGAAVALVEYRNSSISHTRTINAICKAINYYN